MVNRNDRKKRDVRVIVAAVPVSIPNPFITKTLLVIKITTMPKTINVIHVKSKEKPQTREVNGAVH